MPTCKYSVFDQILLGAADINQGNLKIILGLIWTLISHYQISLGFSTEDDQDDGVKRTAKQALLHYIQVS